MERENLMKIIGEEEYHVQEWYPLIQPYTFPTLFIDLTLLEAKSLVRYRNLSVQSGAGRKFICSKAQETQILNCIKTVEEKIDEGIAALGATSGAFVRLSSRSPKDAITSELYDMFLVEREALKNQGYQEGPVMDRVAFTRANVRILRVTSGKQAMKLFLNSNRVHEDLRGMCSTTCLKDDSQTLTHIVVRKWEEILPEFEFRCFVYNHSITAITQYYKSTFVPQMVEMKEEIQEMIHEFFSVQIKNRIPVENYVLDLAVIPASKQIWVVEINNPPPVAGQALFDWKNEEDRNILEGRSPFELRVLLSPTDSPLSEVQGFLDSEREKRKKVQAIGKRRTSF
eukprot:TRINITY_DN12150_c0_g1_i1.p1 TRINITY_DN12150_c0_g1~~TRINITY_DN12150_c0_g1_i1.p1  ORF type:complete len:341 (+),score=75.12 TRINITY_DN12150_c0_g1_i1:453-1475(+)